MVLIREASLRVATNLAKSTLTILAAVIFMLLTDWLLENPIDAKIICGKIVEAARHIVKRDRLLKRFTGYPNGTQTASTR